MRYDIEKLLDDLQSLLSGSLNSKLAEINSEKNDGLTLKQVDSNAYFLQELNGKQINYNPFILYGEDKVEVQSQAGGSVDVITLSVVIVVEDEGEDLGNVITKRMMRYRRALKEVVEDSFQLVSNANILKVQSLPVMGFKIDEQQSYRAIGINIVSAIA